MCVMLNQIEAYFHCMNNAHTNELQHQLIRIYVVQLRKSMCVNEKYKSKFCKNFISFKFIILPK